MIITHTMEMCRCTTLRSVFFTTLSLQLYTLNGLGVGREGGRLSSNRKGTHVLHAIRHDLVFLRSVAILQREASDVTYWKSLSFPFYSVQSDREESFHIKTHFTFFVAILFNGHISVFSTFQDVICCVFLLD